MELNRNDRRLIAALQRDARQSVSELARALDLSRTTVQKRLARLESSGIIAGYHLKLGADYQNNSLQAYVSLVAHPKYSIAVARELGQMEEVEALYTVSGKVDFVAILRANSPNALDGALDRIGAIKGVKNTESAIVLATKFDRR